MLWWCPREAPPRSAGVVARLSTQVWSSAHCIFMRPSTRIHLANIGLHYIMLPILVKSSGHDPTHLGETTFSPTYPLTRSKCKRSNAIVIRRRELMNLTIMIDIGDWFARMAMKYESTKINHVCCLGAKRSYKDVNVIKEDASQLHRS